MRKTNKTDYQNLIENTLDVNHWKIKVESESDQKLLETFWDGNLPKQKSSNKPMSLTDVIFIIFGRNILDDVLANGLT